MVNRIDRDSISALYPMSDRSNHASSSTSRWDNDRVPVLIHPPSNKSHSSAVDSSDSRRSYNPFDTRPKDAKQRASRAVGNVTASRTLVPRDPPPKRRKCEDGTYTTNSRPDRFAQSLYIAPSTSRKKLPQPLLAPQKPIYVSDDEDPDVHPDQSSDPMDIITRFSDSSPSRTRGVVPDGHAYTSLRQETTRRPQQPVDITSDPIETDDPPVPRLDLHSIRKLSRKKGMKTKSNQLPFVQFPTDSLSAPSLEQKPHKSTFLTADQVRIGAKHFKSGLGRLIEFHLKPNGVLTIVQGDQTVFSNSVLQYSPQFLKSENLNKDNCWIQFRAPRSEPHNETITIQLAVEPESRKQKDYNDFCGTVGKKFRIEFLTASRALWEIHERDAAEEVSDLSSKKKGKSRHEELQQIIHDKQRQRSLLPAPQDRKTPSTSVLGKRPANHLRYTPDADIEVTATKSAPPKAKPKPKERKRGVSKEQGTISEHFGDKRATGMRRSSRITATTLSAPEREASPEIGEPDEVILAYPRGVPGAVNVTAGDLRRLRPSDFLNDTLIEFGLKLWLEELKVTDSAMASQIHIFNSFFYKKLNAKREVETTYQSVKKWTSKFDLFEKKYIIVPINEHLHWYLAIIYHPEHILSPPDTPPAARPITRHITNTYNIPPDVAEAPQTQPVDPQNRAESQDIDEMEVERSLESFDKSCTISPDEGPTEAPEIQEDTPMLSPSLSAKPMNVERDDHDDIYASREPSPAEAAQAVAAKPNDDDDDDIYASPSPLMSEAEDDDVGEGEALVSGPDPSPSVDPEVPRTQTKTRDEEAMVVDDSCDEAEQSTLRRSEPLTILTQAIPTSSFYAQLDKKEKKKTTYQKKAKASKQTQEVDGDPDLVFVEQKPKTYIFTFDSLGSKHPQATKKLARYLQLEARDKKGIENAGTAMAKVAQVPVQPNFCDCGLYLLHFAKTFMSDPQKYHDLILKQRSRFASNKEREETWNGKEVEFMRGTLTHRIKELSEEWKESKEATKRQQQQEGKTDVQEAQEESDSDVELVAVDPPVKEKGKAARTRG